MLSLTRIVFPFRVLSFCSLYIILNIVFLTRIKIVQNWYNEEINENSFSRYLPEYSKKILTNKIISTSVGIPLVESDINRLYNWGFFGNFLILFLFICIIAGFLTPKSYLSFLIGFLHFIGFFLMSHTIIESENPLYDIYCIIIGALIP